MKEEIIKVLGQGTFGRVELAKVTNFPWIHRYYAKKLSFMKEAPYLEKELRVLNHFRHIPYIVQCESHSLNFGFRKGVPVCHIYLEYASGGTLFELIKKNRGKLSERKARRYTRMILAGLAALHKEDYVHCDLKPFNILAFPSRDNEDEDEWVLKISDFGSAKEPHEGFVVETQTCRGTPVFMSPEAVGPRGLIGTALDIWSLGCVVLTMFGGRPTSGGKPVIWWNIPVNMPATAKDFVNKCMAVDPSDRWNAVELMRHPFITGRQISCRIRIHRPLLWDEGSEDPDDESPHWMCGGWIADLIQKWD